MIERRGMSHRQRDVVSSSRNAYSYFDPTIEVKMEGSSNIVHAHPDLTCIFECVKNKFYFATLAAGRREIRSTPTIQFFNTDNELVYNNFYNDFGPLNLACLYKYCCKVNKKLKNPINKNKQIVHYTSQNQQKRANAAYLVTSYAILYLKKNPRDLYANFIESIGQPLKPFQDASMGISIYNIRLQDCLNAIRKAVAFGFFNFDDFDLAEYEKYEQMRYGDLNWMIPRKFLAFTGPSTEIGTAYHSPERYVQYFVKNDVIAVVRLNRKSYDSARFTRAGIAHYDMFMPDGSAPPRNILNEFLQLAETTDGPIAVHCKAGLGRTGSLIAAYIVKHYGMSAREAIAWLRICRPGSVIGHQQAWLETMENELWRSGQEYRLKHHGNGDMILHHKRGIYSIAYKSEKKINSMTRKDQTNKKRQKEAGKSNEHPNDRIGIVGDDKSRGNNTSGGKKISKPSIFGKFRMVRGRTPPKVEPLGNRRLDVNVAKCGKINNDNRTQGDRLNEIKAGRNKYV